MRARLIISLPNLFERAHNKDTERLDRFSGRTVIRPRARWKNETIYVEKNMKNDPDKASEDEAAQKASSEQSGDSVTLGAQIMVASELGSVFALCVIL